MNGYKIIGTCSLCGGPVQIPTVWMAITPPVPTCGKCGATQKDSHGPVIEMEPSKPPSTTDRLDFGKDGGYW